MADNVIIIEADDTSRNRIVSDINSNFFVEAGAGSGKTTMLVNRMVAMIEAGIEINKINAITFTKAAAGEFYDRFQKILIERSNPNYTWEDKGTPGQLPKPNEETRKRCAEALQNIDLCFMGTIDSFCNMILSEHPYEAGIPSDAKIMTDTDAFSLYRQLYVKICNGEYGAELAGYSSSFRSVHKSDEDVFLRGITFFMNNRNAKFSYSESDPINIDAEFATSRANLISVVKLLINHPELKYDGNKESREAWEKIEDSYKNIRTKWSTNYSNVLFGLKNLKGLRLLPEAMNNYEFQVGSFFSFGGANNKWLEFDDKGLLEALRKNQYDITMTFLIKSVDKIECEMRETGNLSYFDYLYYLRNMLKDDAGREGKLIKHIYERHSYFLIDEFQDTNPLQAEIFFYLTAERPTKKWVDCVPKKGSLFIVGDPKQSIYRFRGADVTSFLRVKDLFKKNGEAILTLSKNFRSTRHLCEYYNRIFNKMLPEETVNQSKFEEIPMPNNEPDDEFQGIYKYRAYIGKAASMHPDETDPIKVSEIIERLVDREEYKIRTKEDSVPRKIRYSDIMVITYGKRKLGPITAQLEIKGIPTKVEGNVLFAENDTLCEIAKIFAVVADVHDSGKLYEALTGKVIGLSKEELIKYKLGGGAISISPNYIDEENRNCSCRVENEIQRLRKFCNESMLLSSAALFSKIMEDYRVLGITDLSNLEIAYYVLELLRNAEKNGQVVTLKDGETFIRKRIDGTSDEERCLSLNDNRDCVHMANLHKVKGLEAPIVILSDAFDKSVPATTRIQHGDDESLGYVFSLGSETDENGRSIKYCETSDYIEQKKYEDEALKAENMRLIYVAATRARNALIICKNAYYGRDMKEISNPKWKPLLEEQTLDFFETVDPRVEAPVVDVQTEFPDILYEKSCDERVLNCRLNETDSYELRKPSQIKISSKLESGDHIGEDFIEASEQKQTYEKTINSALMGTMVHRLMELIISSKNKMDADSAIKEILAEYNNSINRDDIDDIRDILVKVSKRIREGGYKQKNGLSDDILNTLLEADEVYCEVPFTYRDQNNEEVIWSGIMDVVFCAKGGWHIIDYKTNAEGMDLDNKYRDQLNAYVNAFKTITGIEADAAVYHIDI